MLIEGNQSTQCTRCQLAEEQRGSWPVSLEDFGLDEEFILGILRRQFCLDFLFCFAKGKCLSLSKEVGEQDIVMVSNWVLRLNRREEIAWDEFGSLVDQLVEGVLAIGACLTPDDGTSLVVDSLGVLCDEFAVAFHLKLLQIVGKASHVLVVRENSNGISAVEVVVPDSNQGHDHGKIVFQFGRLEVAVHLVGTFEELLEALVSDDEGDRQANGGPEGVSSANPVPELQS